MEYRDFLDQFFPKEDVDKLLEAMRKPPISGVRFNTLKCVSLPSIDKLEKNPYVPNAFYFNKSQLELGKMPHQMMGLYYIQDPSAMMVAPILKIEPNNSVIDLCAAPGGKATQAANYLSEDGLLVANDFNSKRALDLSDNVETQGIKNALITNNSVEHLSTIYQGLFDRVILDAPCSGEGMFRKNSEALDDWSVEKVERLASLQKALIIDAYKLLKKDGLMTYSTCTFNPLENESVVRYLLDNTNASLVKIEDYPDVYRGIDMPEAIRLLPSKFRGEGHFIALIKCNDEHVPHLSKPKVRIPLNELKIFEEFVKSTLNINFDSTRITSNEGHLYYLPKKALPTNGLKVLRHGLYLGYIKGKFFIPSHSLALASKPSDWQRCVELNETEFNQYIKGLTLPCSKKDGYALVTFDNYALGFGKVANKTLKNFYPKHLRR